MSKRYIPQTPNNDFVYPNNDKVEYDINIVHEINDNTVSGSISGLTLSIDGSNLVLGYQYTWNKNDAQVWVRESGRLGVLSVHMLAPGQEYFSAWRMVDSRSVFNPTVDVATGNVNLAIAPSSFGLSIWPEGDYLFEFRFIGLKQNYVICETATVGARPTPTPTATPCTCNSYSITNNSSESQLTYTYIDCDTGVTNEVVLDPSVGESRCACSGSVTITIGSGTVLDQGPCAVTPTPTPIPPTPTPAFYALTLYMNTSSGTNPPQGWPTQLEACEGTGTPITVYTSQEAFTLYDAYINGYALYEDSALTTPYVGGNTYFKDVTTPGGGNALAIGNDGFIATFGPCSPCTYWFLEGSTQSGELLIVEYNNCAGDPQQITLAWNSTPQTAYICAQAGSVVVVDQGLGTSATNTGTPCS